MLYQTALQMQQTDFTEKKETVLLVSHIEQLVQSFQEHADHENRLLLPAVGKYNPQLAKLFGAEHEEGHRLSLQLITASNSWLHSADKKTMHQAGKIMSVYFNEFIAFSLYHMNMEEQVLNDILWRHYTDRELIEFECKMLTIAPTELLEIKGRWIMKGISNPEIINWLSSIKDTAPQQVFQSYLKLAEELLPAEVWERVKSALADGFIVN